MKTIYKFPKVVPTLEDTSIDPDHSLTHQHILWLRLVSLPLNLTWAYFVYALLTVQFHCLLYEGVFNHEIVENSYVWTDSDWMAVISFIFTIDVGLTLLYKRYEENVNDSDFAPSWAYVVIDLVTILVYTSWVIHDVEVSGLKAGLVRVDAIRCLRVVRILRLFIYQRQIVLKHNVAFVFIQFLYGLYFTTMIYTIVGYQTGLFISPYNTEQIHVTLNENKKYFFVSLFQASSILVAKKAHTVFNSSYLVEEFAHAIFTMLTFLWINGYIVGELALAIMRSLSSRIYFRHLMYTIRSQLTNYHGNPEQINTLILNYHEIFRLTGSIMFDPNFDSFIPQMIRQDIYYDAAWSMFNHAHIFRGIHDGCLRRLAERVKREYYMPDEVVYSWGDEQTKLIYIFKGILHVESMEDAETSIIAFTSGTTIGESALVLYSESRYRLIAQTVCQVQILERKDFLEVMQNYKKNFKEVQNRFTIQLQQAIAIHLKSELLSYDGNCIERVKKVYGKTCENIGSYRSITVVDPKFTLARMQMETGRIERSIYTVKQIDRLVLIDDQKLVEDSFFVKDTFPYILQKDSLFVRGWNVLVYGVIVIMAIWLPYISAFQEEEYYWNDFLESFVNFIFACDVLIQLQIGVRREVGEIALFRLTQVEFYIDLLATFPFLTIYRIMVGREYITQNQIIMFRIIRLSKIFKIEFALRTLLREVRLQNPQFIEFCKNLCFFVYVLYCFGAVIRYEGSTVHEYINRNRFVFYKSAQWLSFIAIDDEVASYSMVIITIVFKVGSALLYYGFLSWVIAVSVLEHQHRFKINYLKLADFVRTLSNNCRYEYILLFRMECMIALTKSFLRFQVHKKHRIYSNPRGVLNSINENIYMGLLKKVKFFDNEFLKLLCNEVEKVRFPVDSLILYSGSVYEYMYIIENGICEGTYKTNSGTFRQKYYSGDLLNSFEFAIRIPSICTVTAHTDVRLLPIPYDVFIKILSKFQTDLILFKPIVIEFRNEFKKSEFYYSLRNIDFEDIFTDEKIVEVVTVTKYDRYKCNHEFEGSLLGLFMLRTTFSPSSEFVLICERIRCFFAIITAYIVCSPFLSKSSRELKLILIGLDLTAYVDIYLRFHLQYYLLNGITVKNPKLTAKYYLTHALITDIIASFPFNLIDSSSYWCFFNRLLQLYRVFHYVLFYVWNNDLKLPIIKYATLGLISTIIIALLAQVSLSAICKIDPGIPASINYTTGVICEELSWMSQSRFIKPLTPFQVYLYGLYFSTSILSATGLSGFRIENDISCTHLTIFTVIGYIYSIHLYTFIVAMRRIDPELLVYYRQLQDSIVFIADYRVKGDFRKNAITFWQHVWKERLQRNPYTLFQSFADTLQEDILLSLFGNSFEQSSIFRSADIQFLRTLLRHMQFGVFHRGSFITRRNDIQSNLFFVNSGLIEVEDADTEIVNTLTIGCIFGNLQKVYYNREKYSYIGKTHIQALYIEATIFYELLSLYPYFESIFLKFLYESNGSYVTNSVDVRLNLYFNLKPGENRFVQYEYSNENFLGSQLRQGRYFNFKYLPVLEEAMLPNDFWYQLWFIYFILLCLFSFTLDLYRVSVDSNLKIYIMSTVIDVCYSIQIYIRFHLAYENLHGDLVTNLSTIRRKYSQSIDFKLDIATLIPLFLIPLILAYRDGFWVLFNAVCHLNRLSRIRYVIRAIQNRKTTTLTSRFIQQILILLLCVGLLTHGITCLKFILHCSFRTQHSSRYEQCTIGLTLPEKWYLYYHNWLLSFKLYSATNLADYVPQAEIEIIFSLILMIAREILLGVFISQCFKTYALTLFVKQQFEAKLITMDKFLRGQEISGALIDSLWLYMCNFWRRRSGCIHPVMLYDSPHHIKEPILNAMFGRHITKNLLFQDLHPDFIRQVVCKLMPRTYYSGVYVTHVGYVDDCMYFVDKGEVKLEDAVFRTVDAPTIKAGDFFGVKQGLFEHVPHTYSYKILTDSVILSLRRQDWFYLLDYFEGVKENIYTRLLGDKINTI